MSLKALPVFESLMRHRYFKHYVDKEDRWETVGISDHTMHELINAHRISCNYEVPDPITERNDSAIYLSRILGRCALPFPVTWVEWKMPAWAEDDGDHQVFQFLAPGRPSGALCMTAREVMRGKTNTDWHDMIADHPDIDPDTSWQMVLFHLNPVNSEPVMLPGVLCIALDSEGQYVGVSGSIAKDYEGKDNQDQVIAILIRLGYGAIQSIGWINCRNVDTDRHEDHYTVTERKPSRNPARRGKAQRVRKTVDYHTIRLPGGAVAGHSGGGHGDGESVRLHKVRGHFKTFTQEAPLMGRHVGTYWWAYQLRGSKSRGVSVSDYEVKVS